MLSVTMLEPLASARTTAICGCISVGNPGYGSVFTLVDFNSSLPITRTLSSPSMTWHPISSSFADKDSRCFGMTSLTVISPLVAAAANINVPASIWSGIIEYVVPCRRETPLIRITSVPAPLIFAPIAFKKFATSTICGSFAAFSRIVSPSAMQEANIRLIVAPTVTTSK